MDWREYIEQRPDLMGGKPFIKGTQLTVGLIIRRLAEGDSETDLLRSCPDLCHEHILAALKFAAELAPPPPDEPPSACGARVRR